MSSSGEESSEPSDVTVEFVLKLPNRSGASASSTNDANRINSPQPARPTRSKAKESEQEATTLKTSSTSIESSDIVQWKAKLVQNEEQLKQMRIDLKEANRQLDKEKQEVKELKANIVQLKQKLHEVQQEHSKEQRKWQENAVEWKQKADSANDQLQQVKSQTRRTESLLQAKSKALEEAKDREKRLSEECASRALRTQLVESQLTKVQREMSTLQSDLDELRNSSIGGSGKSLENKAQTKGQSASLEKIKKELEASCRHVRVLTTRLARLERQCESQTSEVDRLSSENARLHVQLRRCGEQMLMRSRPATPSEQELRAQLEIARDVLMKMHSAMQTVKGEKLKLQEQLQQAKVDILDSHLKMKATPNSIEVTTAGEKERRASPSGVQQQQQREFDQLLKDLQASGEREGDLQEQLQYSEREADSLRRKLASIEQENELLSLQLKKLVGSKDLQGKGSQSGLLNSIGKSSVGGRSLSRQVHSMDEQQLMDQLKEEELRLLGLRLEDAEQNVQKMQRLLEEAQKKLQEAAVESEQAEQLKQRWARIEQTMRSANPEAAVHMFYQQKVELLENEARELRKRLLTSDQQRQSMQSELNSRMARKPPIAVKSLSRSSSLHN